MEVDTDDDLLRTLAAGGSIDNTHWPRVLNTLVSRIESNCYNNFAIPVIPPPKRTQSVLPDWTSTVPADFNPAGGSAPETSTAVAKAKEQEEDIDKENTEPDAERATTEEIEDAPSEEAKPEGEAATSAAANTDKDKYSSMPPPPVPAKDAKDKDKDKDADAADTPPKMPAPAVELIEYITSHLTNTFPKYPPHSIQRLAELVVFPHQHYRYLGPYLSALERVVSVTSGSNRYPLPSELPPTQAAILNGTAAPKQNGADTNANGDLKAKSNGDSEWSSDTSWGALLTPIPWLRGQQPNNSTDDDRSTTEEAGGDGGDANDGSSPLDGSSDDGSEMAFSTTSSTAGPALVSAGPANEIGGLRDSHSPSPSRSPSPSPVQTQQTQQLPTQQVQPQRRLEVRTEATETIDGPNGVGSIETVSVSINGISSASPSVSPSSSVNAAAAVVHLQQRGITQGELLRQEQKAGVVPVSQLARAAAAARAVRGPYRDRYEEQDEGDEGDDAEEEEDHEMAFDSAESGEAAEAEAEGDTAMADEADTENTENEEEIPHARGPQELGAADMGPQRSSSSTSAPGLQIGSAADDSAVHTVHMNEIDLESAVGRAADALPEGAVAAPLVPSVDSESEKEKNAVRATTPKREAEPLDALPAKKRKGEGEEKSESNDKDGDDKEKEKEEIPEGKE